MTTTLLRRAPLVVDHAPWQGLGWTIVRRVIWLVEVVERQRTRRALLELDDHRLRDIGLSRADAIEEGSKPFWVN